MFASFFSLFFPPLCLACRCALSPEERHICRLCFKKLPLFAQRAGALPDLMYKFYGILPIVWAQGLFSLDSKEKGSPLFRLLYAIKYEGQEISAAYLGHYWGLCLRQSQNTPPADYLLPIPLHPHRLRVRGYNQSHAFAEGLSTALESPLIFDLLKRVRHTDSQTHKSKSEREQNVADAFVCQKELPKGRPLLVDDVITSGATMVAAGRALLASGAKSLCVGGLAVA